MRLAFSAALAAVFVLLQTTVLHRFAFRGVIPDLSLIVIVFAANKNGTIFGQSVGFAAGIVEGFLSLSPLGLHALVKTLIGFFVGMTFGVVFMDSLFIPMLMVGAAAVVKNILSAFLMALTDDSPSAGFFSFVTLIEIAYTMILSPFVFAFLGFFKILVPKARG